MILINNLIIWVRGDPFPIVEKVSIVQVDGNELDVLREVIDVTDNATIVTFRNAGQWDAAQEIYNRLRTQQES